jgi:hypothetical protein
MELTAAPSIREHAGGGDADRCREARQGLEGRRVPTCFDAGDVRSMDACAPCELGLGQPGGQTERAQSLAEAHTVDVA